MDRITRTSFFDQLLYNWKHPCDLVDSSSITTLIASVSLTGNDWHCWMEWNSSQGVEKLVPASLLVSVLWTLQPHLWNVRIVRFKNNLYSQNCSILSLKMISSEWEGDQDFGLYLYGNVDVDFYQGYAFQSHCLAVPEINTSYCFVTWCCSLQFERKSDE